MLNPVMWSEARAQKQFDQIGYLRSQKSELLYDEIEALGATYPKANAASKRGIKTGLDGKTSILPVKGDGIRRVHLLLLSLGCTRSKDPREVKDELCLLHEKFTGDARLEKAIAQTKEKLESAALVGVAPQWEDVEKPIQTAVEHNCTYFYAKAATEFSDGKLSSGGAARLHCLPSSCSSQSLMNALLSLQGTMPFQKKIQQDPRASPWRQCK